MNTPVDGGLQNVCVYCVCVENEVDFDWPRLFKADGRTADGSFVIFNVMMMMMKRSPIGALQWIQDIMTHST
jgi:hypothetical protein